MGAKKETKNIKDIIGIEKLNKEDIGQIILKIKRSTKIN